jgi:hypothetical protein
MKFKLLAMTALLLASTSSFAAGRNIVDCGATNGDDTLAIHQDSGGQLVALYSMLDHGTLPFEVGLKPVPTGTMGAGITYFGKDFSMKINTDGSMRSGGFATLVSISALKIRNESFNCKVLN